MRIFLTGAGGYIGSAVADAAARAGHEVTGLVRSERAAQALTERGLSAVVGDLSDGPLLMRAASQAEGVIHDALPTDASAPLIDRVATSHLLAALEGSGKSFVYTSGGWVLGNTDSEDSAPIMPQAIWWRPSLEQVVLADATQRVRVSVIRPGIAYGGRGGLIEPMIAAAARDGIVQIYGDGANSWMLVHRDDLAALYVLAVETAPAGSILLASSSTERLSTIAAAASRAGGGGRAEFLPLKDAPPQSRASAEAMAYDQRAIGRRALALGWRPSGPSLMDVLEGRSQGSRAA